MRLWTAFLSAIFGLVFIGAHAPVMAQTLPPLEDWEKRQNVDDRLRSYGEDILGDQIDPHTGTLVFEHTDVSLPGNFPLEVAVHRRRAQGFYYHEDENVEFGDWQHVVPRVNVVTISAGWIGNRCSNGFNSTNFPNTSTGGNPWYGGNPRIIIKQEYSNGVEVEIPGAGSQQLLATPSGAQWPVGAVYVTAENWWFECTSATDGGQGLIGHAPNGDIYTFNKFIDRKNLSLGSVSSGKGQGVPRRKKILAATLVTDKNGNSVSYNYEAGGNRLTSITSSDNRTINFYYDNTTYPSLITRVVANGRTWTYAYRATTLNYPIWEPMQGPRPFRVLETVTQPDSRSWTFTLDGMSETATHAENETCTYVDHLTVGHPYGTTGVFDLEERKHRQGLSYMMPYVPNCPQPPDGGGGVPAQTTWTRSYITTLSVVSKTLSGPQISPPQTWYFEYEQDTGPSGSASEDSNWTKVTQPGGAVIEYKHYWTAHHLLTGGAPAFPPGKLKEKRIYQTSGGALLETTTQSYLWGTTVGNTFVYGTIGGSLRPQTTTINRLGDTYTTVSNYDENSSSSNYSFGFPISVTESSSTTTATRTTDTVYAHNSTKWVLGLPSTVTKNTKLFDSYTYDTLARVATKSMFGTLSETYTYHTAAGQKGAVATYTDGHTAGEGGPHTWTLSSWKRGKPQSITRPGGLGTFTRVVDDNGWVTSETDYRGTVFGFSYNSMGWLAGVDYPTPYNDLTVGYSTLGSGVTETRTRGSKKTTIKYDGLFRPTQVKAEATDGSATTNYVETAYDIFGRTTFQSWPSAISGSAAGTATTYDALGRPLTVAETVAPYATTTTQYLSGGETRVTDPANAVVRTFSRAFGDPDAAEPMSTIDPMGATTTFGRDVYGNVTQLDQAGNYNGFNVAVQRKFWYDSELQLCRHRAPEFGDEVFVYDSTGLLTQSGRAVTAGTNCVTSVPAAQRIAHGYDAIHRETLVDFPSGTPDITRAYDGNGNATNVTRVGGAIWDYTYTALDAVATEQLQIDGRTYTIGHSYNGNGDLTGRSNSHSGITLDFNANAFGELRRARVGTTDYISNAVYHPNGLPSTATYLNGQLFSQTLNGRQLPDVLKTEKPGGAKAVWITHGYDVRRKLTSATDSVTASDSRTYGYDSNGRLLTATGPWGTNGLYVYDALGNLRSWTQGVNTGTMAYDGTNRVVSYSKTGDPIRNFTYDERGNTTSNGDNTFIYDFANQPTSYAGAASGTHAYDGNLKRVKTVAGGKTVYTLYSKATGNLVYRDQVTDNKKTDYAEVGGAALRLVKSGSTVTPNYIHYDAQGSVRAATNSTGGILWRESYTPWGTRRTKPAGNQDNTSYTGHLVDSDVELVYMQARYYDSQIGRFYSTDPIGYQDQLNLYAYVHNDPVNATDPTGQSAVTKVIKFIVKGGDLGATFAGNAEDLGTLANPAASGLDKAIAVVNLASELAPVSTRDVGDAAKAAKGVAAKLSKADGPYKRPSGATTKTQRESVQGKPCVKCGATTDRQVAGHKEALVKEHHETGSIDTERMRSVDAVQPECPTCSAREGAEMSRYSREMNKQFEDKKPD